ncbi:MAG: hypothetical protein HOV81_31600 [Kofleriaceae bacterium]|nr:hypothetical protein [Kofleriaceae bacterium]
MSRAVILIVMLLAACHRQEPAVVRAHTENTETRDHVQSYVTSGRTPAAFATLAVELESVRHDTDPRRAEDAELRLLALALPLVEETRSLTIDAEVERLALTVWPVLLGEPLTGHGVRDVAPRTDEDASAYIARLCGGVLSAQCGGIAPDHQAIAVRAVVLQRAEQRMRDALATCLMCGSSTEPGWRELEWKWESLERAALRAALEVPRVAGSGSAVALAAQRP